MTPATRSSVRRLALSLALGAVILGASAGWAAPGSGRTPERNRRSTPSSVGSPTIAAAGDIACDRSYADYGTPHSCLQEVTADLMTNMGPDAVLPLGDNEQTDGSLERFQQTYDPSWGRFNSIARPVPGNHEYGTPGAAGYFQYFGQQAGDPSKGYYSYDIGGWHLIALNSNCLRIGGCGLGSPQWEWLQNDLAASNAACTIAYWHHPAILQNRDPSPEFDYSDFWKPLYDEGVEIVLNGHYHNYHRFVPQNPYGERDRRRGIRQFIAGTGGASTEQYWDTATTAVRDGNTFGVLELTLNQESYDWRFVPEPGARFSDSGSNTCH